MANILIADDHAATRTLFHRTLRGDGYRVATASDGAQACAKLATGMFDLFLTDLQMPRGGAATGIRFARENLPGMPIVVCTASRESHPVEPGEVTALLEKPVSIPALRTAVRGALGARGAAAAD